MNPQHFGSDTAGIWTRIWINLEIQILDISVLAEFSLRVVVCFIMKSYNWYLFIRQFLGFIFMITL